MIGHCSGNTPNPTDVRAPLNGKGDRTYYVYRYHHNDTDSRSLLRVYGASHSMFALWDSSKDSPADLFSENSNGPWASSDYPRESVS